jgi:serine/threonine-protein kinase
MAERGLDLVDLATRVSDGARVDWDAAERSAATDEERQVVRHLRLVESVASVHRSEHGSGSSPDPGAMSDTVAATLGQAATLVETDLPQDAPRRWGPLEVREKIGEGAFGEVYRARDVNLDAEVALKLLKPESSETGSLARAMVKEGRLLARVRHPNVVTVHGAETRDGRVGLWMDFVRGRSLHDLLEEQGRLGAREAALIGLDLCRALTAVHGAGLVHRDVKARNVMREEGGRILLMDFGAGRDVREIAGREERTISGTPLYIAPEVYDRQPATPRSDIYSLGVLLYHLVTGSYPVEAATLAALKEKHRTREMRLLRDARSDLPEAFVNVVERALARDPAERFATAGEMERALAAALGVDPGTKSGEVRPRPPHARIWRLAAMTALIVVGVAVVWLLPTAIDDRDVPGEAAGEGGPAPAPPEDHVPAVRPEGGATSAEADAPRPGSPAAYSIDVALYRDREGGRRDRLASGSRVQPGDVLSLDVEASRDLFVYVLAEDEKGEAWALFPNPELDLANPLAARERHTLPGTRDGSPRSWEVTTVGGKEHLLVFATPERLIEFEAELDKLPRPREGQMAVPIPPDAKLRLRGIGGLAPRPERAPDGTADRLFEMADELAGRSEVARGAWVRHIELENPGPER